jgi:hypothetical protein
MAASASGLPCHPAGQCTGWVADRPEGEGAGATTSTTRDAGPLPNAPLPNANFFKTF